MLLEGAPAGGGVDGDVLEDAAAAAQAVNRVALRTAAEIGLPARRKDVPYGDVAYAPGPVDAAACAVFARPGPDDLEAVAHAHGVHEFERFASVNLEGPDFAQERGGRRGVSVQRPERPGAVGVGGDDFGLRVGRRLVVEREIAHDDVLAVLQEEEARVRESAQFRAAEVEGGVAQPAQREIRPASFRRGNAVDAFGNRDFADAVRQFAADGFQWVRHFAFRPSRSARLRGLSAEGCRSEWQVPSCSTLQPAHSRKAW